MSAAAHVSVRDYLYEEPGPKTKRAIQIGTAVAVVLITLLIVWVIRLFAGAGQLDAKYWTFFTRWTTWRFLGMG